MILAALFANADGNILIEWYAPSFPHQTSHLMPQHEISDLSLRTQFGWTRVATIPLSGSSPKICRPNGIQRVGVLVGIQRVGVLVVQMHLRFHGVPAEERLHWRSFQVKLGSENLKGAKNEELLVASHKFVSVAYTILGDVCLYIVGKDESDELALAEVVFAITSSMKDVCGKPPTECLFLDKYGRICLCLDEIWKEALVLLLDVGPSMHGTLQEVEKVCSTLVRKKLVYHRSDEVGVVLFGTKETCNDLAKELGGYKHVMVAHEVKVVDEGTIHAVQNLPKGTVHGDFLDAIVVGLDMLIRKSGSSKGKQRLYLIADVRHALRDPPQGTKEDQVDTIAEQMKIHGINMECIVFREPGVIHDDVIEENDRILDRFRVRSVARVVKVDSPTSLLGAIKSRNVLPSTIFRGDLELSSNFKIKVWVYKKTSEERFPTLKKYSEMAPPSDTFASHEVKVDYEYKSILEPDKVVPPDQRIKGYLYGPQVVPISSAEWAAVKFKPEKGVKLLGFTDRSNIFRHYFMKDVYSFIPEPGNTKAMVAVSAIARAMQEMNKVAILRCVWRQGQGNVAFGVLSPNVSSVNNVPDSFYFNILPFAEDIREFQFRSFSSLPSSSQPTEEQQEAADNLVRMLDLAPAGKEEILKPDLTPNPMLERFYNFLDLKSQQPDANVPPLDRCLRRITEPDPDVIGHETPLIENLGKAFELKEISKKKKAQTQNEKVTYRGVDDQAKLVEGPSSEKVGKIGDSNPVQDFETMLSERVSSEWVQKAIEEMQTYTTNLLECSSQGKNYQKALDCFVALRKACIIEQEPQEFNRFLTRLYERWRVSEHRSFFKLLSSKSISLISKKEAPDSDITEEKAYSFYVKPEPSA